MYVYMCIRVFCVSFTAESLAATPGDDVSPMETGAGDVDGSSSRDLPVQDVVMGEGDGLTAECNCMPERAALIKSILNFLKKAIPEPTFAENIRNCECILLVMVVVYLRTY